MGSVAALLLATSASAALGVSDSGPVGPQGNVQWSLTPYTSAGTVAPRIFFSYNVVAGQTVRDDVRLANFSDHSISFLIYPSDASTVVNGGAFTLEPPQARPRQVGTWITPDVPTYKPYAVPPRTEIIIPFKVTVPAGTRSGDYAGGIVAQDTTPTFRKSGAIIIGVKEAIGVRIYLRVTGSGSITPAIVATGIRVITHGRGFFSLITGARSGVVQFRLANIGNTRINATAVLSITGTFSGKIGHLPSFSIPNILPGAAPLISVPWPDIPELGVYHIHITVDGSPGNVHSSTTGEYIDVPWLLIAIVIAVILLLVGLFIRGRRKKRRSALPHESQDSPSLTPAAANV